MTYSHRPRNKSRKLIDEANKGSLTHLLKNPNLTIAEKRALVAERNPFIYALGTKLKPWEPWTEEQYADYIDRVDAMHERLGITTPKGESK